MAEKTNISTIQDETRHTTATDITESVDEKETNDDLQGFVKIAVRGTRFDVAKTTLRRSAFWWRFIKDPPNSNDGVYQIDRDSKIFRCLMNYLVTNSVPDNLPCSVRELYYDALFYGIALPEDDCWGTTLLYTLKRINTYNIRAPLKSFADRHGIFGWAKWKQRISVEIEFHCHRTMDLNLVHNYMIEQESKEIFRRRSTDRKDQRMPPLTLFDCPKTDGPNQNSKYPPRTPSSTSSSNESCPESAKDLIKRLTVAQVQRWVQQTMFHQLAQTWFTKNVNGKELLEISKTGHLTNGTLMLSGYDLIRFRDILNRFGFELELE